MSLLGFAAKAGKLSFGMDAAVGAVKAGRASLLTVAGDISEKSKKEVKFFADKYSVRLLVLRGFNIETVTAAVGRKCGILSVNDSGFADAFLKAYVEGGNANDE